MELSKPKLKNSYIFSKNKFAFTSDRTCKAQKTQISYILGNGTFYPQAWKNKKFLILLKKKVSHILE